MVSGECQEAKLAGWIPAGLPRRSPGFDHLLKALALSVPASYKAIRKVPRGAAPVPAGAETSAVRLCPEVRVPPHLTLSPYPIPAIPRHAPNQGLPSRSSPPAPGSGAGVQTGWGGRRETAICFASSKRIAPRHRRNRHQTPGLGGSRRVEAACWWCSVTGTGLSKEPRLDFGVRV